MIMYDKSICCGNIAEIPDKVMDPDVSQNWVLTTNLLTLEINLLETLRHYEQTITFVTQNKFSQRFLNHSVSILQCNVS